MINYIEKGYGLFTFLSEHGVSLYQLDGNWMFTGDKTTDEVNALIVDYNPWPDAKAKKFSEVNGAFMAGVSQLVAGSTPDERNSWPIQESEARAKKANPEVATPALSVLSAARGIPLDLLVDKVIEKSDLYKQYYFGLQGLRDRAEDRIKALPNSGEFERLAELDAIYFGV